jgi:hypothetical protein
VNTMREIPGCHVGGLILGGSMEETSANFFL